MSFRFGSAFVLGVLLAVAAMGSYAYSWARRTELQRELNDLNLIAAVSATRIDIALASGRGLAEHLAGTRDVQDYLAQVPHPRGGPLNQAAMEAWLDAQTQQVRTRGLSTLFVMTPDGACVASSDRGFYGRNFRFRTYFQEAMAGHLATSDWVIGSVNGMPRLFSAAPVRVDGKVAGVLVAEFMVDDVEKAMAAIAVKGRTAAVLNAEGVIVAHSEPALQYHAVMPLAPAVLAGFRQTRQFLDRDLPVLPLPGGFVTAFLEARDTAQPRTVAYQTGGHSRWAAFSPMTERPWVVMVSMPENEVLLPVHKALRSTLLAGVAITLVIFLLGFALGRALLRPLLALSEAMRRFGAGDTSARAPVRVHDERGRLAETFNGMADALQRHQEHLEDMVAVRTRDLETTLAEVRTLRGMIPICSYCKKIRDDEGGWWQLERYIHDHSEAEFSHGICPECTAREFPEVART